MNTEGLQECLLFTVVLGVPYFRILRRAGLSPYYAALVVVPFLGYLAIEVVLACPAGLGHNQQWSAWVQSDVWPWSP